MKHKRIVAVGLAMAMLFSMTACSGGSDTDAEKTEGNAQEETGGDEEGYFLGYSVGDYKVILQAETGNRFEDICEEKNIEYAVKDAQGDSSTQLDDVNALIAMGIDGLLISPVDGQACAPAVEAAAEADIPVAVVLRDMPSVQDLYVTFSGTDDIELGELGAQGLVDAMGESGKIVYISGTPGLSTAEDRTTGFHNIIDQYDGIEIIAEQACDYNRAKAMETMEAILQANSEIDAVWCANDEMAGGVVQAIDAAGRTDEILVGGANLQSDGYQRLLDGTQAWDVTTPPMMLDNALDAILTVLDGGTVEKRINAELDIVTKDNAADFEYQVY
ncbi:MAG TPA: sugar ABC transporter substrate-binding protein [Candidatus Mediterraneibacter merdipullorum]|nr:sugar ABC transporter substrate-binding protein [Candidatus Mediterraneibacter merdipullorum]